MKKYKIDKYLSELDIENILEPNCVNLIISSTGSGKTRALLDLAGRNKTVAFVAPFVSITSQLAEQYDNLEKVKGMVALGEQAITADGRVCSFHSIPRLLELKNIDILVIDEIHYLPNYAGFTRGMLTTFWATLMELKNKHPEMKIVALTATPQFIRLYTPFDFNEIFISPTQVLSKPAKIEVKSTFRNDIDRYSSYLFLYDSKKNGAAKARNFNGHFISSDNKETSPAYYDILQGRLPADKPRIFTSTVLSTGISITDPVDYVYTHWLSLSDIVQTAARPRQGGHILRVQKCIPWHIQKQGMLDEPLLNWSGDFEKDMKLLNQWTEFYSWAVQMSGFETIHDVIYQLFWAPEKDLPNITY